MVHVRVHYIQSFTAPGAILYSSHIFGEIRDGIFKLLRSPGIDSKESVSRGWASLKVTNRALCWNLEQSMGARNRVGTEESIPWINSEAP